MQKKPPKSSKYEMLSFGLCSNSDDQRSNPSNESQPTNSEWPILHDLQLLQSFLTEVAQNDSEWPLLPDLQLLQSFPTKVAENDLEWPISSDSQLF